MVFLHHQSTHYQLHPPLQNDVCVEPFHLGDAPCYPLNNRNQIHCLCHKQYRHCKLCDGRRCWVRAYQYNQPLNPAIQKWGRSIHYLFLRGNHLQ